MLQTSTNQLGFNNAIKFIEQNFNVKPSNSTKTDIHFTIKANNDIAIRLSLEPHNQCNIATVYTSTSCPLSDVLALLTHLHKERETLNDSLDAAQTINRFLLKRHIKRERDMLTEKIIEMKNEEVNQ